MGNHAIYSVMEHGKTEHYYSQWGANALSPMLRLQQSREISEQIGEPINHILAHLGRDGSYQNPRLENADMFCDPIVFDETEPREGSGIEMFITLDLDNEKYLLDYNESFPPYISMGKYEIPIEVGMKTLRATLDHAENNGIDSFAELVNLYHQATGLDKALERSRGDYEVQKLLDSPEAEQMREKYAEIQEDDMEV